MESEQLSPSLSEGSRTSNDGSDNSEESKVMDISPKKDRKLMKKIIRDGEGCETPSNGNEVEIHYIGKSEDGTVFDSSRDSYKTFSFLVGANKVIDGWEIAIKTMKRGELSVFVMAPELAKFTHEPELAERGMGLKIPKTGKVFYEIELFDWKFEDVTKKKDRGVTKRIITDGEGCIFPDWCVTCEANIIGKYNDRIFENRNIKFSIGEAHEENIIEGVEIAIRKMKKMETAEVHIKPQYAFKYSRQKQYGIPEDYEEVVYEITLKNFETLKQPSEMNNNERIEISEQSKTKGTIHFYEFRFKMAIKQYKRIVRYLNPPNNFEGDQKEQMFHLLLGAHLNLALCYIKLKEFYNAVKQCDMALVLHPKNEKALFRRGLAYFTQKEYDLAIKDFSAVLKLNPDNKAARNKLIASNNGFKAKIQKDKSTYRNMFGNVAKGDVQTVAKIKDSSDVYIKEEEQCNYENISGDVFSEDQMIDDDMMTITEIDESQHP